MNGRPWTPSEDLALKRNYYRYGAEHTAQILTATHGPRTPKATRLRARKILTHLGVPQGYVPLIDVHRREGHPQPHPHAIRRATRDGVIKTVTTHTGRTRIVPQAWADEYHAHLDTIRNLEEQHADWLTSAQTAHQFGVVTRIISCNGAVDRRRRIYPYLQGIRRVQLTHRKGRPLLWHPADVHREAMEYRRRHGRPPARAA